MRPLLRSCLSSLALRLRGRPLRAGFWLVILVFLVRINGRFLVVLEVVSLELRRQVRVQESLDHLSDMSLGHLS